MSFYSTVLKLPINGERELHVVLQDRSRQVIFSIVNRPSKPYRERTTFELLAKFIAGIQSAMRDAGDYGAAPDTLVDEDPAEEPDEPPESKRARTAEGFAPPEKPEDDDGGTE
jgi:hypothetical protein